MKNFSFIDWQNLNLWIKSQGFEIDYRKLRLYLKNKYFVDTAFLFLGFVEGNQKLYTKLQKAGFILIFKPTIAYKRDGVEVVKGNVDAELVLRAAAREFNNYDKAIIISWDWDFCCLIEFLIENDKLLKVLTPNNKFSSLLRKFYKHIIVITKTIIDKIKLDK
jgi:uncharacterized LabA/DUF88 family protein